MPYNDSDREARRKPPIYIYRGEPVEEKIFQPVDSGGSPVDPSTWTITFQLYRDKSQTAPDLEKTLTGGGLTVDPNFYIVLNATATESTNLTNWRYEFVMKVDDGASPFWYVTGEAIVKDKLTL